MDYLRFDFLLYYIACVQDALNRYRSAILPFSYSRYMGSFQGKRVGKDCSGGNLLRDASDINLFVGLNNSSVKEGSNSAFLLCHRQMVFLNMY